MPASKTAQEILLFHFAIQCGSLSDLVEQLHEFNINLKISTYSTALVESARIGAFDKVEYLLQHPAIDTSKHKQGLNALIEALSIYYMQLDYGVRYFKEAEKIIFALLRHNKSDLHDKKSIYFYDLEEEFNLLSRKDLISQLMKNYIGYQETPNDNSEENINTKAHYAGQIIAVLEEIKQHEFANEWKDARAKETLGVIKNSKAGPVLTIEKCNSDFLNGLEDYCHRYKNDDKNRMNAFNAAMVLGRIYLSNNHLKAAKYFYYAYRTLAKTTIKMPEPCVEFLAIYIEHHSDSYSPIAATRDNRFRNHAQYLFDLNYAVLINSVEALIEINKYRGTVPHTDPLYAISEYVTGNRIFIADSRLISELRGLCRLFETSHFHAALGIFWRNANDVNATREHRFYSHLLTAMSLYQLMGYSYNGLSKAAIIESMISVYDAMREFYSAEYAMIYHVEIFILLVDFLKNSDTYANKYSVVKELLFYYSSLVHFNDLKLTIKQITEIAGAVFSAIIESQLLQRTVNWKIVIDTLAYNLRSSKNDALRRLTLQQFDELDEIAKHSNRLNLRFALKKSLIDACYHAINHLSKDLIHTAAQHLDELQHLARTEHYKFMLGKYILIYLDYIIQLPDENSIPSRYKLKLLEQCLRSAVFPENEIAIGKLYKLINSFNEIETLHNDDLFQSLHELALKAKLTITMSNEPRMLATLAEKYIVALIKVTQQQIHKKHVRRGMFLSVKLYSELVRNEKKLTKNFYGLDGHAIKQIKDHSLKFVTHYSIAKAVKLRSLASWYLVFMNFIAQSENHIGMSVNTMLLLLAENEKVKGDIQYAMKRSFFCNSTQIEAILAKYEKSDTQIQMYK